MLAPSSSKDTFLVFSSFASWNPLVFRMKLTLLLFVLALALFAKLRVFPPVMRNDGSVPFSFYNGRSGHPYRVLTSML